MQIHLKESLPFNFGERVENYLKVLKKDEEYEGYTISDDFSIIRCQCRIANNGSWNNHKNEDDSHDELQVHTKDGWMGKWWTLSKEEVIAIQDHIIVSSCTVLKNKIEELNLLLGQIKTI